jgi:beta-barrel assembly-enhancing protease
VDISPTARRAFLIGASCAGWSLSGGLHNALAAVDPRNVVPTLTPQYKPNDKDERGLWMQMEQIEADVKKSNFLLRDPTLNAYLTNLCCKLAGDFCPDVRVYVLRTPYFNASMYPNGMMQIWSGLLLRAQNEAQLAAVVGHEIGHYLRQHSLKRWREIRNKTSMYSFLSIPLAIATAGLGNIAAEMALIGSLLANSREDEREADAFGLKLMDQAGLAPGQASRIWKQLIDERDATAKAQGKKKARAEPVFFATHPQSAERMFDLATAAANMARSGKAYEDGQDRYSSIVGPHRIGFFDDQLKLEDFGGTEFLLAQLAQGGWTAELLYFKGELFRQRNKANDLTTAADAYRAAIALPNTPRESYRGLGYTLLKSHETDGARASFKTYLELRPDAPDRAMIEFNLQ